MTPSRRRRASALAVALFTPVALGACGSSATKAASTPGTAAPAAATTGATTAPPTPGPKAIVSLSPTATEILFAIGAGSQVIAVDDQSNYPPEAPKTDLSGFKPNVEAIIARKPDLVVISDDSAKLVDALGKVSIKAMLQAPATTLDDTYQQIADLGAATGHAAEATTLATKMKADVADLVAKAPKVAQRYYHELGPELYSASSSTFIGQVYALFGLQNIADAADKDKSGYPQLSQEYIVAANPQIIFLADTKCCQQDAAAVAGRPGWAGIDAVSKKKVVALDDDIASRWGPRVVDFARTISSTLGS
jgi:iron complex transport system substrate-binding protein